MPDQLEELILSGEFFDPTTPNSPPRTPTSRTPSPTTSDELLGPSPSSSRSSSPLSKRFPNDAPTESIGMGPGRTGVKGVIRDRNEALALERDRFQKRLLYIKARQEKTSLAYGGKTTFEEDELREKERIARENVGSSEEDADDSEEEKRAYRSRSTKIYFDLREAAREDGRPVFGHLREVAPSSFIKAIEEEDQKVWVLVHLYEPHERCQTLDTTLALLSRQNPHTKFLRARAAHFDFAVKGSKVSSGASSCYADEEYDECQGEEVVVDTELLPTLLVYRGGELEFTWVRVDLEAGHSGIGALLKRHGIIQSSDIADD